MRIHFNSAYPWGIVILEIRPKFWGRGLKNRGLQEQSAYWGRKLPCSFKKGMGHLLNKRNKDKWKNPSNVDLKVFRKELLLWCFRAMPWVGTDLRGSPLWGGAPGKLSMELCTWEGWMGGLPWENETAFPVQSLGLYQLSFSALVELSASSPYFPMGLNLSCCFLFLVSSCLSLLTLF